MALNLVLAANEVLDGYALGNDIFTEVLTVLFMLAVIVCAVFIGSKLRKAHDAKSMAAESAVAAKEDDVNS